MDIFVQIMKGKLLRLTKDINEETGELLRSKQQYVDNLFNDDGYRIPSHKGGAKLFNDIHFPKEMNDSEIGKMTRLSKLMVATSNMLGYRCRRGILPYTEREIIDILGLSYKRGKEFIDKMKSLAVMQENKKHINNKEYTEFYINPVYFFAGKRININLYLLFREQMDAILPPWVRWEFWQMARKQEGISNKITPKK